MEVRELQISYRKTGKVIPDSKIIKSKDAVEYLHDHCFNPDTIAYREEFFVLHLNNDSQVISYQKVSEGGVSAVLADPKIIFGPALIGGATSIIVSHNHPSGKTRPSEADIKLTKQISAAGKNLEIIVLDHIIITPDRGKYLSIADDGLFIF